MKQASEIQLPGKPAKRQIPVNLCQKCHGSGLIELQSTEFAWQAAFTMLPCQCPAGEAIRPAFEAALNDPEYRQMWVEQGGQL